MVKVRHATLFKHLDYLSGEWSYNVLASDCVRRVDWEYCERDQPGQQVLLSRRLAGAPQVYAPERGPPLLDFLFVLTAFFAATFAAFYTILSETGVNKK